MLVWQVCLASVCLPHSAAKATAFYAYLASRRVCAVPLLPQLQFQVYVGFSGAMFLLLSHSLVHHPLYHLGTAMHCSFGVSSFSYGDV